MTISDPVLIQIIISSSSALAAIVAARLAQNASTTARQTHEAVNSRMDKFLQMAEESFRAKGKLDSDAEHNIKSNAESDARIIARQEIDKSKEQL